MTKEIVEQLREEYLAIDKRDWPHNRREEWFISEEAHPDYVWLCASRAAAFARAKFWNADSELTGDNIKYIVQRKKADGTYEVVTEEDKQYV